MTCENHKKTFWNLFLNTLGTNSKCVPSSALYNTWFVTLQTGQHMRPSVYINSSPLCFPFNEKLLLIPQYSWGHRKGRMGGERETFVCRDQCSPGWAVEIWGDGETGMAASLGTYQDRVRDLLGACTIAGDFCSALLWKTHDIGLHEVRWKCWSSVQI